MSTTDSRWASTYVRSQRNVVDPVVAVFFSVPVVSHIGALIAEKYTDLLAAAFMSKGGNIIVLTNPAMGKESRIGSEALRSGEVTSNCGSI
jgi:hypothetical protein